MRFVPFLLAASLVAAPLAVSSQEPGGDGVLKPTRITRTVADGVTLLQETWPDGDPAGPLVATIAVVDPKRKGTRVEAALGQDRVWGNDPTSGREAVSTLAVRHKATVAVNAAYFPYAGNPIGLHIQNGEMVTEPGYRRTCFLLTKKGEAHFAAFTFQGTVSEAPAEGAKADTSGKTEAVGSIPLDGMNRKPAAMKTGQEPNELLLFTPTFSDKTIPVAGRTEVVLEGVKGPIRPNHTYTGTVRPLSVGGATPLLKDTVVLSGSGAGAAFLKNHQNFGTRLRFRLDVATTDGTPFDFSTVEQAVAGGPRLLANGAVTLPLADEKIAPAFSSTRHPRTAVGMTKDGKLLFVVVDGRQQGLSRGASLPELAELLRRHGAVEAVNLDGGGSSTCVVRGALANLPSDGEENAVASMLMIFGKEREAGPSVKVGGVLPAIRMHVGYWWSFAPRTDRNAGPLLWGIRANKTLPGFIRQDGTFFAVRPGTAIIQALPTDDKGVEREYVVEVSP